MSMNVILEGTRTSTEPPNISLDETSLVVVGEDMEHEQEGTEAIKGM